MATCPLSGQFYPDIGFCHVYPGRDICACCPAYGWRVRLAILWRWLRLLAPLAAAMLALFVHVGVAEAHNPLHDCPAMVAQAILAGQMGGTYYGTSSRVTWTDGTYVCVFTGGKATTFFKSRNAASYLGKDAMRHGATVIAQEAAAKIVGAAKRLAGPGGTNIAALPCYVWQKTVPGVRCTKGEAQ